VTRWQFQALVRTVWAYSDLSEPVVRAGLFAQLLRERRR
jgi:hypothetical protein